MPFWKKEPGFSPIINLQYRDKEKSRRNREERGVIYDIHCETADGKLFTVEMQNSSQNFFLERLIYYSSKSITDQGLPGSDWKYKYLPVYCVAFMNFELSQFTEKFRIDAAICDLDTKEPITDKLRFILLQLPNFKKREDMKSCDSAFEQWMYNIINMPDMNRIAFTQERKLFERLDKVASYAALNEEERREYDADLKAYRDIVGQLDYAWAEGEAKGRADMIKAMYTAGIAPEMIAGIANIPIVEIKRILNL